MSLKQLEPIESLMKICSNSYKNFMSSLNNAHNQDYHNFKVSFREDCFYLMKEIAFSIDEKLTIELLYHFKNQLDFVNENSLSAKKEEFDKFLEKNYPYIEKVENIKAIHIEKCVKKPKNRI